MRDKVMMKTDGIAARHEDIVILQPFIIMSSCIMSACKPFNLISQK